MADRTIGELDPVKEVPIGDLPQVLELYDDSLLPVEQQGMAMRMTGRQFRQYGEKSAEIYVQTAVDAADAAKQSEANAAESERQAREYSGKPPVIRQNEAADFTWWTWDAEAQEYRDTGEIAVGNVLYAAFFVDETTGELYEYYDKAYTGPQFQLRDGADLEVILIAG